MNLRFVLPLAFFMLSSCSKDEESILLECSGVETTYAIKNGIRSDSEERNVKKSFNFYKEKHDLKINAYLTEANIKEGKFNESEKTSKVTWTVAIDNGIPYFEEDSIRNVTHTSSPVTEKIRTTVVVEKDVLGLNTRKDYKSDDHTFMSNTLIDINRISGVYFEKVNENSYYPKYKSFFEVITEGSCKSGERKF
jgi:hypothetical protein